jgi:hypothetical protein
MLATIVPKSDQLNADDLIGRTMTITATRVDINPTSEQPVAIHFEGDNGKPYKPGKSMRRVLVKVWGPDANAYSGKSMTLYCDEGVVFGGVKVGGIRISHMSHITAPVTMALTEKKGSKKPFVVKPLAVEKAAPLEAWPHLRGGSLALVQAESGPDWLDACRTTINQAPHAKALEGWAKAMEVHFKALEPRDAALVQEMRDLVVDRLDALSSGEEAA